MNLIRRLMKSELQPSREQSESHTSNNDHLFYDCLDIVAAIEWVVTMGSFPDVSQIASHQASLGHQVIPHVIVR